MDRDEERRIIAQVCAGDANAFEALVVAYQKDVYKRQATYHTIFSRFRSSASHTEVNAAPTDNRISSGILSCNRITAFRRSQKTESHRLQWFEYAVRADLRRNDSL